MDFDIIPLVTSNTLPMHWEYTKHIFHQFLGISATNNSFQVFLILKYEVIHKIYHLISPDRKEAEKGVQLEALKN